MEWDVIATIAEVVSAIAVVVSLIYLALQIRQSNRESESSTLHHYLSTQTVANNVISENGELAELIVRANDDFHSLTPAELIRLQFVFYNHFNQWLYAFEAQRRSLMEDEMWGGIIRGYTALAASSPAFRDMWNICGTVYQEDFRNHVNTSLENAKDA